MLIFFKIKININNIMVQTGQLIYNLRENAFEKHGGMYAWGIRMSPLSCLHWL
jgi:hypothetical protein